MKGGIYENKSRHGAKWIVRFGSGKKGTYKRFNDLKQAERFLTGLRYKHDEGTYDPRDYKKDNPLGFETLANRWLEIRSREGLKSFRHIKNHMRKASLYFGNRGVNHIKLSDLQIFNISLSEKLSEKTRHNIFSTVKQFFKWIKADEGESFRAPQFPAIKYELGWRNIVGKETQIEIIEEVRRISYHINPKIWFGIFLLASFPEVRPGELRQVREGDFDLDEGTMTIQPESAKEGKKKIIYLLEEDIDFIRSQPRGFPQMPFFRHAGIRGIPNNYRAKSGGIFGRDYFGKWWNQACKNLGVKGVSLYPGTKHTSATYMVEGLGMSPEEVRKYGTGHRTNAAFDRYLLVRKERKRVITRNLRGKVLEFGKDKRICTSSAHTLKSE